MTQHFDILIVGAGSAGSVLASRLSEDSSLSVGLIEAGGWPDDPHIAKPAMWPLLQGRSYDWRHETVPQPHTASRKHPWPRGRLVGGSSCLHAMAHVRGHPNDFDAWAAAGGDGWSFDTLLPYFRRSERFSRGADAYHGADGPLDVLLPTEGLNPVTRAYMAASEAIGIEPCGDHNGARMEGAAPNSLTLRDGKRLSVADAYLTPDVTSRTNLTILTGVLVDRLSIDANRATGLLVHKDGVSEIISADRIVLSAGAVASPTILMRSGIGDSAQLAGHSIPCTIDNPAVGDNLHDHLLAAGNLYRARRAVPPSNYQLSESLLYHGGGGSGSPRVVVACVVVPVVTEAFAAPDVGSAYTLMFGVCHPRSRGRLTLASADPRAKPLIDPAYLSEREDRSTFREALDLARSVGHAAPMDEWRAEELLPGPSILEPSAIDHFVARAAMTHHHPVGTCRMGPVGDGVVDGSLRLHGLDNVFVVDASVIPTITSGPINAAIVAMAERAADLLKAD
ncbi:MAG: GMC family oxidoreductase N-terminal domain-containing protein [Pseudomonadota bacterium]